MKWRKVMLRVLGVFRQLVDIFTTFLFSIIYNGNKDVLPPITNLVLLEPASSLATKIRTKKLKSSDLVEAYIGRIKEVQPLINAIVDERFKEAIEEAKEVDLLIQSGTKSQETLAAETPFLGVPFTTKDSISVKGLSHTAGLVARKGLKAETDADAVALLRKAGAIPVAVTNVSEMCMWWESANKIYGRTNNPYNTARIVGGSSGGEAAINAAAGSVIGIGSDVGGSIRMPSFFCGVFGHKPSPGIVSNDGQLPVAEDTIKQYLSTGPICRYATDLLPMLKVLARPRATNLKLDSKVDLQKIQVYYCDDEGTNPFITPVCKELKEARKRVLHHFQNTYSGNKPQKVSLKKLGKAFEIWSVLMVTSAAPSFAAELTERRGTINPFVQLAKWFVLSSPHTLPAIALSLVEKIVPARDSEQATIIHSMCADLRMELQALLGESGVLLYPSHPEPAPYHNQPLFKPLNFSYTAIFNSLGFPVTQCPLGLSKSGLPLGIQVVGAANCDYLTLTVAVELEKAFGGWVVPSHVI